MKILWLNWRDIKNPQAGGAEVMTHETAKRLVATGNEVLIFTSKFPGSRGGETIDGVKIVRAGNRLTCRFWAFWQYRKKFKGKVDIVIDEINTIPFFTPFYVRERKFALIHQLAREFWWSETFFPLNLLGFLLESVYLKPYKKIPTIAASQSTKRDLNNLGFEKVFVFHQGLSVKPLTKLPIKSPAPEIIFIGRLTKPKGPQDAITAFRIIKNVFPAAKLIIAGKGKVGFTKYLKKLASKLDLQSSVDFAGFVSEVEKIKLLGGAKVILIPSVREGWNLVPVEANAAGCVPIGYQVPGLRNSIRHGETGILTKKNNPQHLAKAAISILSDNKLQQKLATNGLLWSKNFDWSKTYASFIHILKSIPIKILWLSWRDIKNPDAGGAEKVAIETTSRFVKDAVQVTIFTSKFPNSAEIENFKGVKIIRRGNLLTCRVLAFFYYRKTADFDLVIDEINTIPFFSILYARRKTVVLMHQLAREYWFTQTFWPVSLLGFWLEPIILKLYCQRPTIVVSQSTRKDLVKLNFGNIKVIREGLDIKPQLPKKKENLVIFIGRLTRAKGPHDAIAAFKIINSAVPKSKLVIMGKGDVQFTRYLKKLAKNLELSKKVQFTDFVPQTKKLEFLKKAKVVLIPSVREGWNLVATEANATGCIPVGYNVPGLRDSIKNGKNGLLVKPNPATLAKACLSILNNEDKRLKLAATGYNLSKKFSWKNTYADIKNFVFANFKSIIVNSDMF